MILVFGLSALLLPSALAAANLTLSSTLSSYMVLQQAPARARIWGTGEPHALVHATALHSTSPAGGPVGRTAVIDASGRWQLFLPPTSAASVGGKPFNLTVSSGASRITLTDLHWGEVWLCTGQSNMALPLSGVGAGPAGRLPAMAWSGDVTDGQAEIRNASQHPLVRIVTQGAASDCIRCAPYLERQRCSCDEAQNVTSSSSGWRVPSPSNLGSFSATCWMFGRRLQAALGSTVALGLVQIAVGGTAVELWSSREALAQCDQRRGPTKGCADPSTSSMRKETTYTNSTLFNAMISPWTPMAVRGTVWYQAESNVACSPVWPYFQGKNCAMSPEACSSYYDCQFGAMMDDWRARFSEPWSQVADVEFAFVFVQLPAYVEDLPSTTYGGYNDTSLPLQRLAQARTLLRRTAHTRMASLVDHGWLSSHYGSIHPMDKTPVGKRLMLAALEVAYPQLLPPGARASGPCGPVAVAVVNGTTLALRFDPASVGPRGLMLRTNGLVRQTCPVGKRQTTALPVKPTSPVPITQCGSPTGFEVQRRSASSWEFVHEISLGIVASHDGSRDDGERDRAAEVVYLHGVHDAQAVTGVRYLFADWPIPTVYSAESFLGVNGELPACPFVVGEIKEGKTK